MREPTVPLTVEGLREARHRWQAAGIGDYDLRYRMHGATYDVSVRDGIVTTVVANGNAANPADAGSYGMDGLLNLLAMELENAATAGGPFVGGAGSVLMRVRFHAELGYLERYLRSGGGPRPVAIELLEFKALE